MYKDDLQLVHAAITFAIDICEGEGAQFELEALRQAQITIDRLLAEGDSKPSSVLDVVGYLDDYGSFEPYMQPWMADEPDVNWRPVYLHPATSNHAQNHRQA